MPASSALAVLMLLSSSSMAVGPLLPRGEGAPHTVCSAFAASAGKQVRLFTARHCLTSPHLRVWLPGLEGNAMDPGTSRWSEVHPMPASSWTVRTPGEDLAHAPVAFDATAFEQGSMPVVGDVLEVRGYPGGVGPVSLSCAMAGVVILDLPVPRLRPSLRCTTALPSPLKGMSGGPVLNEQGQVVGVLASGTPAPEGGTLLGFEPLDASWLDRKQSRHALITDEGAPTHRVHIKAKEGVLEAYWVASPTGTVWSWWPQNFDRPAVAPPL